MAGSTPIYGFPYPQSTDLVADYPTLGQELATDVENVISGIGSGLSIVTPTSIANSGGSASASGGAVTFSGVSSVSLNGIFTSTYANYRLIISGMTSTSGSAEVRSRFRVSGSDATSSDYYDQGIYGNGTTVGATRSSAVTFNRFGYSNNSGVGHVTADICSPHLATSTGMNSNSLLTAGGPQTYLFSQMFLVTTAFDGITFIIDTGTFSGTIRVYGYKNS